MVSKQKYFIVIYSLYMRLLCCLVLFLGDGFCVLQFASSPLNWVSEFLRDSGLLIYCCSYIDKNVCIMVLNKWLRKESREKC